MRSGVSRKIGEQDRGLSAFAGDRTRRLRGAAVSTGSVEVSNCDEKASPRTHGQAEFIEVSLAEIRDYVEIDVVFSE
jgi:hypothetical protein